MIEPKDKAKELVEEFSQYSDCENGKQCALICVDEIINSRSNNMPYVEENREWTSDDGWEFDQFMKYWKEVKQEIKKS